MLVSLRGYRDVNSSSYLKISDHSLNLHQIFLTLNNEQSLIYKIN